MVLKKDQVKKGGRHSVGMDEVARAPRGQNLKNASSRKESNKETPNLILSRRN